MGVVCLVRAAGAVCLLLSVVSGVWAAEAPPADAFALLAQQLQQQAATAGCTVAYVVHDLRRGDAVHAGRNIILPAASLIKVPVLVEAFAQIDAGLLRPDDTFVLRESDKTGGSGILRYCAAGTVWTARDLLRLMIVKSDNTATDMLLARLGMARINARMRRLGLTATRVRRKILDYAALRRGIENTTTAYEMARLLQLIHTGRAASPASCRAMLDILLAQEYNDRIPRLLPAGVAVAHKTGTMHRLTHDAGIVYTPDGGAFSITVLVQGLEETGGETLIAQLARRAYDYFAAAPATATAVR